MYLCALSAHTHNIYLTTTQLGRVREGSGHFQRGVEQSKGWWGVSSAPRTSFVIFCSESVRCQDHRNTGVQTLKQKKKVIRKNIMAKILNYINHVLFSI